jgi:mono/diheme cytochrome c family protein
MGLRKAVKYLVLAVVALVLLAGTAFGGAVWMGERKMQRSVDVRVVPVPYTKDPAALRLGKYLFESRGCGECHGMDGRGRVLIDNPNGLYVRTPSIAPGPGSAVAAYAESDWVRAIRHGIDPKGRALLIMPSEDYNRMNDGDFAALVAYARSLPSASAEPATIRFPAFLKALYAVGAVHDAAGKIDHRLPPPEAVPVAANAQHGGYVANMCIGCHGAAFAAARSRARAGVAARLQPNARRGQRDGALRHLEKLAAMMRSGKRPDGSEVSKVMPFADPGEPERHRRAGDARVLPHPARAQAGAP